MSGDTVAVAALSSGLTLMVMGAVMIVVVAYAYQGAHTRLHAAARDRRQCDRYHRLSKKERKIWRVQAAAAGRHAAAAAAPPADRGGHA